jgi:hypothetical protein
MSPAGAALPGQAGPAATKPGDEDRITIEEAARLLFVTRRRALELLAPGRQAATDDAPESPAVRRVDVLRCRDELRTRQQAALAELVRTSEALRLYDAKPGTPPGSGR